MDCEGRMEKLKFVNKAVVFPIGILYFCVVLMLLLGISIPNMAGPVNGSSFDNSSNISESSGHGSLMDILGIADDDDDNTGDDGEIYHRIDGFEDEGGGASNGSSGSDMGGQANTEGLTTATYALAVQCFRCHGDGTSGCNIVTMMLDIQMYSVTCHGKCLNLTSGLTSVYDCAHDMLTHVDTCLQNEDTVMCFCTGDFCNGPPDIKQLLSKFKPPFSIHKSQDPDDYDYNYEIGHSIDSSFDTSANLTSTSLGNSTNKTSRKYNRSNLGRSKLVKPANNFTFSYEYEIFNDNSTDSQNEVSLEFQYVENGYIDFVIPEINSSISENSALNKIVSNDAVEVDGLRVGKLKDSGRDTNSGIHACHITISVFAIAALCSLLFVCVV